MRKDLNKLLCERERSPGPSYRKFRRKNSGKKREGMRAPYSWQRKEFGESFGALKGWLHKQVGRKWDDSFSELSQNFDTRKATNQHILTHLYDWVKVNVMEQDGKYYVQGYSGIFPVEKSLCEYWVHPRTGIVMKNEIEGWKARAKRIKAERAAEKYKTERKVSDNTILKKENDIWFFITTEVKNVIHKVMVSEDEWKEIKGTKTTITRKSASKKDKKQYKLD